MSKVHMHTEQFDGAWHPWCGLGTTAVSEAVFNATPPEQRCKICERDQFPNGQPDWHLLQSQLNLANSIEAVHREQRAKAITLLHALLDNKSHTATSMQKVESEAREFLASLGNDAPTN